MFIKGEIENVRKAVNKEELAMRYCFEKAYNAESSYDSDLWEIVAYHVIPARSRCIYDLEAARIIKDEERIYEPDTLDETFKSYKRLCQYYNRTPEQLVEHMYDDDDLDAYIKAHYVPA